MNEVHSCNKGKTYIYKEFAECYGKVCSYFGTDEKGGWCWKIADEVGHCDYREVR